MYILSFTYDHLKYMSDTSMKVHSSLKMAINLLHTRQDKEQSTHWHKYVHLSRIFNNLYTKFLGLIVDNTLSWKPHIDHLINKLSTVCYVIRSVKPYVNANAIIMIYHSLFHAVMTYGIIFWGNSSHSIQGFRMQKKAIRIIMGRGNKESCRNLFKELNILPLTSQYILSLLTFVSNNRE
jgi:hypothetical protein